MKGTLKLENGRELTVEIDENALKSIEKPKKTGYERVDYHEEYYCDDCNEVISSYHDVKGKIDNHCYYIANYYSDKTVAENNARADALMRKLRRFAVEHRQTEIDWKDQKQPKWCIEYLWDSHKVSFVDYKVLHDFGQIYFDTPETVKKAIEEFEDELIWYFTEYKDSL